MASEQRIIELDAWLKTPPGRYLLGWEEAQLDEAVTDAFGFHALQLGLPEIDGLRNNRMPHRWVACASLRVPDPVVTSRPMPEDAVSTQTPDRPVALHCDFDALPFASQSLDLVVLPHSLELARDPHLTLREVERVLRPEGRVMILGFNPASLWGLRQRLGRVGNRIGIGSASRLFLPRAGEFIGYWRLRDWLRLLSFEVEGGRFGCYRPPFKTARWLERFAWLDAAGEHGWSVFGAVYFVVAVKRVRGMRLVGLARRDARKTQAAPAVVAQRRADAALEQETI